MKIDFAKFDRLEELEKQFKTQVSEQEIHLFGDLAVSKELLDELASLIHYVFVAKHDQAIKTKYALSTSIFLVWCSICDYKEGTFWEPVFSRLKIRYNPKVAEFLGETFLATLKKFDLQQISNTGKTKKYMTPILMHGYIGDHYAGKLLDYLNAAYTSYLKYDVSERAMEGLWSDLFNLEDQQISIKSEIETLEEKEHNLKVQIQRISIPANLRDMSRSVLKEHESNAYGLREMIQEFNRRLGELDTEIQRYLKIKEELNEYQLSFEKLPQISRSSWMDDSEQQLNELQQEISDLVNQKLHFFYEQRKQALNEKIHDQSQYEIEMEKIKALKTNILTLGKGREEEGWLTLNDFQEIRTALELVQGRLTKKRSLDQMEEQWQNTSLKQILTASLTHLALENPSYFQSFIRSTLLMLDGVLRNQPVNEAHRMYEPIHQWMMRLGKNRKVPGERESSIDGPSRTLPMRSRKANSHWRLVQPKLRQPSLSYDSVGRNLFLTIPEQQLLVPKNFQEQPRFELIYSDRVEKIDARSIMEKNKMVIQERKVSVIKPDVKHLAFRWLNLSEYWPISLEPVLVFNENRQLMTNSHIPNGFYYILALANWRTDSPQVIDQYIGGPEGYRVYEVQTEESEIKFWTDTPNNEVITLQFSRFSGIDLKGVEILPGVFMDGIPVCSGASPLMTIGLQAINIEPLIFSLFYQGELLLQRPLRDLLDHYGQQISPYALELDLAKLLYQKAPPQVENVKISITDPQGQEVFEKTYCQVRGVNFIFAPLEIMVKIPAGARLRHPSARQEGTTYHIPIKNQPFTEVELYFDRIGWNRFQLETPEVQFQLADHDGQNLDLPLYLLGSEAETLKQISVNWHTKSSLPEKVILFDEAETLVSTFHLKHGQASAHLNVFYDIMQDLIGSNRLHFRWEGKKRSSQNFLLAELFDKVEVVEGSLFQTERETDNLFEIRFRLNFPYNGQLMIRVNESEDTANVLVDQGIATNPFYLYINKEESQVSLLTFEIYYLESTEDIFGTEEIEVICWKHEEKRMLKKAVIQEVLKQGLVLQAFSYEQERYTLKDSYRIEQITMEPRHFEAEELYKGTIKGKESSTEVYFYLDVETQKLPFLIDADSDGVQYHPATGELFWENRSDREIMAPLDDVEYQIKKENNV